MSKRKLIVWGAFSLTCLFICSCATNPITGEDEFIIYGEDQDIAIGRQYAPEMEKQLGGKIPDAQLQDYVNSVGQKVAGVSHRPDFEYHFTALDHNSINAFALPGGYIFITRGMLEKLKTESQLASILAHETAHVVARDTMEAMSREMLVGTALSVALSREGSSTVSAVADVTRQIISLKYSREDEKVADIAGMDYMVAAGYNPYGMIETFEMLESENESSPLEFLSTHPSPENRTGYIAERIELNYYITDNMKTGRDEYQKYVLERLK
jgi:predicted Zn-dependent protease